MRKPRAIAVLLLAASVSLGPVVTITAEEGGAWRAAQEDAVSAGSAQDDDEAALDPNVVIHPDLLKTLEYRSIGPSRGGRSTAVTGVPGEPFTFYMGTSGGGVWKTTNAGQTWSNVSDKHIGVGSIGAVAVAPSDINVVYVGTGSACPRGNVSVGDGIYRSTDAGKQWHHIGLPEAGQIARVRVHPDDPDLVYVAALGHIFGPNEERGVFRSRDGGETWDKVLYVSETAGAVDLTMNPDNPRILYAAIWRAERKPWTLIDGGEESGIYRTTDGGDTWERLEGGLPNGELGRIGISVSPANPDRVWALITAQDDNGGVWRSDDGGDSWRRISGNRELRGRGWYYSHIVADPTDANTVYSMNAGFYRSIDGGATWQRVRTPHGDNHDLWINPDNPAIFVEANDGGAAVTVDGGRTWTTQLNQTTAEFYRVTVDDQFPYRVYGAQQDNSTISVSSGTSSTQIPFDWYTVGGGESGHIAVKPGDPDTVYAGNYIGQIERFDRSAAYSEDVILYPQMQDGTAPKDLEYRFQWNAPIMFSRHDPDVLYHASNYVHRTRDGGISWQTVSPDLTTDNAEQQEIPGGPIQHDHTGVEVYNTVFSLAESPLTAGELWAGSDDGRVHVSRDNGATWTDVTPVDLPQEGTVNSIDVSSNAAGRAVIAVYRYRVDDMRPYVFRTEDHGASWDLLTDGTNGIPEDHFVRVVREDPDRPGLLYAGTEFGMFASFDDGAHWQSLQLNLPVTPITDLVVHRQDLVVATQGRSFWILDDLSPLHQLTADMRDEAVALLQPRDTYRLSARGGFFFGGGGLRGAAIRYWLAEAPEEEMTLEILDTAGEVVRTFKGKKGDKPPAGAGGTPFGPPAGGAREPRIPVADGMNRFVWDLRVKGAETVPGARFSLSFTGGFNVVPGDYQARLTVGETVLTQGFEVRVDPRVDATQQELQMQYDLLMSARDLLTSAHTAVKTLRSAREQANALAKRVADAGHEGDWTERAKAIADELTAIEDELIQSKSTGGQDPINFPPQLDDQIAYMYSTLLQTYGRPTEGSAQRYADLEAQLQPLLDRLAVAVAGDIAAFNQALADAGLSGVILKSQE